MLHFRESRARGSGVQSRLCNRDLVSKIPKNEGLLPVITT
ncbi:hypothetical protein LEMLEM_LOCUS26806, partial [Lemmus lemmus]